MSKELRPGVAPVPHRMLGRPVERGWPVPWFCALVDGAYDFRIVGPGKFEMAIDRRLCWLCGRPLQRKLAFVIGPMCAINRTTSEPPSHCDCAAWAVRVCPFLTQRQQHRNAQGLPATMVAPPGEMIARQPGVALVWQTLRYTLFDDGSGGALIRIGDPIATSWHREGRAATRAEVLESIASGLPTLLAAAELDGPESVAELERRRLAAMALLPAA